MFRSDEWQWTFFSFESTRESRPVQDWYDKLPEDHKSEVSDLLRYMANLRSTAWDRPLFDHLEGAGVISEIRVPDIRDDLGVAYYRIYGFFGLGKQEYTFLHANNKKARNDRDGKAIAKRRFEEIKSGSATRSKFQF